MALTPPPAAPQRGDRATFAQRVDAFITWMINFVTELVALVANLNSIAAGGAYALPYVWGATGSSGSVGGVNGGRIGTDSNAAAQNVAVILYVDNKDAKGSTVGAMLDGFAASSSAVKGIVRIVKVNDASVFLTMNVTAVAASGNYRYLTVANTGASSASPFANGDAVVLHFQRTGDKGDKGDNGTALTPIFHVNDTKPAVTNGGSPPIAGTNVRTLNTIARNTIGAGASLSGNQVTLPAGTYRLEGNAPANGVGSHRAYLYNITNPAVLVLGSSEYDAGNNSRSWLRSEFTLSTTTTLELRHWIGSTSGNLGASTGSGFSEIYSELQFEKLA